MDRTYYDLFIENKKWTTGPRNAEDSANYFIKDLLIACYEPINYDSPFTIPQFDGELESFTKILERFKKKSDIKEINIGKSNPWYIHPICVVIMGVYRQVIISESHRRPIDLEILSDIACRKIRDLLNLHSQVKKVSNIKIIYEDPIETDRPSDRENWMWDRYGHHIGILPKRKEMNYLEFLFCYSEYGRYLCNAVPDFVRNASNIFIEYSIDLSKSKNFIMNKILHGRNESSIVDNLKLYASLGGNLYNVNEGLVLANAIKNRQSKLTIYLLKKGYSLKLAKNDWMERNEDGPYSQDVQMAAIYFGLIDVLKYCVEERKINYFKQYRKNTFAMSDRWQNHRLLHVAVFSKQIDIIDYLLSKNEDLSFKGECEFSPGELGVMLAARWKRTSFYQLLDKPKMSYSQYKVLVGEGEQYYTDDMDCPVCMDYFGAQEIIIFGCGHAVCKDCFGELLNRNSKCPICRAEIEVNLRVKLELGTRKVKSKGKSKKKLRKTKSLPNLKRRISSNSNSNSNSHTSIYSANNNSKQGSRSMNSSNKKSINSRKSKKKRLRRVLSDNITNFELVSEEQLLAEEERGKRSVRNKSVKLFQREERNEALNNLRGRLNKKKLGRSPTQKYRKGKLFPSPVTPKKKASKKAKSAPVAAAAKPRTPSPPRDFSAAPRRSGRERKPVKY